METVRNAVCITNCREMSKRIYTLQLGQSKVIKAVTECAESNNKRVLHTHDLSSMYLSSKKKKYVCTFCNEDTGILIVSSFNVENPKKITVILVKYCLLLVVRICICLHIYIYFGNGSNQFREVYRKAF